MAAATVNSAAASYETKRICLTAKRHRAGAKLSGEHLIHVAAGTIPATSVNDANDIWVLLDLRDIPEVYLTGRGQITLPELDTGTNLLVWDLVVINADDSVDKVLINDSTIGRAAGTDEFDVDAGLVGYNVGGKRIAMKTVTAANVAAAGAVVLDFFVFFDRISIG